MNLSKSQKNPTLIEAIVPKIENKTLLILKNVVLILSFAVLTGISAGLKIEVGPIPVTMQTLIVLLSGILLGAKKGATSQITYLLAGLTGLPWFSRGGGMIYIMSPTFGYILGFVMAAYLVGSLAEKKWSKNIKTAILAMLIGNAAIYIPGLLWLAKFTGFKNVLAIGLYPFILGDALKLLLAGFLLPFIWKITQNNQVSNKL